MDVNLGFPNEPTCTPAERMYSLVQRRVEAGNARFFSISANRKALELAEEKRIPAAGKLDLNKVIDFLGSVPRLAAKV